MPLITGMAWMKYTLTFTFQRLLFPTNSFNRSVRIYKHRAVRFIFRKRCVQ
uniref:Uncharacterized protein n=1 Tax=Romanomermis culicivorax TaxID=13658 RepID=A0A915HJP2_ROMCU